MKADVVRKSKNGWHQVSLPNTNNTKELYWCNDMVKAGGFTFYFRLGSFYFKDDACLNKFMNRWGNMEKKIFIFDVDGTLTDGTHRQHHVRTKPKRWDLFNAKMHLDTPHDDIIFLAKLFFELGHTVLICSGRDDGNKAVTEKWLADHGVQYQGIYMRKERDYRSDDIVKMELLAQIRKDFGEPFMVFDDRSQVVNMWRENGVRCCQVAPGDF